MTRRQYSYHKPVCTNLGHLITALFAVCILTSCIHSPAPHLPSTWIETYTDLESITNRPQKARLQVIIASGVITDNHTALRLESPGRPVVFWDPGGGYGTGPGEDVRRDDLIIVNPPDLETYLPFRWENHDAVVEIFEWDLEPGYALELHGILMQGTDKSHPRGKFTTESNGLFCSLAVSGFLNRFATPIMNVPQKYFLPHKLARVLYTQSPDRVLVFRRNKLPMVYVPPPNTLDVTHSPTSVQQ